MRTGTRKTTRAEVPVTARIRARGIEQPVGVQELQVEQESAGGAGATSVPATEPVQKPEEPPAAPPALVIAMPEPFKPVNGHAKAVVKRRQGSGEQLRLF